MRSPPNPDDDPPPTTDVGRRFRDAAELVAFLQTRRCLEDDEEVVDEARTHADAQAGEAHMVVTTHRIILAKSHPRQAPRVVFFDDPASLEWNVTVQMTGRQCVQVEGFAAQDVARIEGHCKAFEAPSAKQCVLHILDSLGIRDDPNVLQEHRGSSIETVDVLGRRFGFNQAGQLVPVHNGGSRRES